MTENMDDTRLVTILLGILGAFVIIPMFFVGLSPMMGFSPMMDGMWGNRTIPGWLFIVGIVMGFLFLAVLLGGGYLLYRTVTASESDSDQALEELRLAYARGELTDENYEQRRETLERDTK